MFVDLVGSILPYFTISIFVLGMILRIRVWMKLPSPAMTLFPTPKNGTFLEVLKETFFFPGIFKSDKILWIGAWIFHVALALIFLGHLRVIINFGFLWNVLGMDEAAVNAMSATSGGIAGIIILLFTLLLIVRRFSIKRVRQITGFTDYFALFLVLAILITGNLMRFGEHFDLNLTQTYFAGMVTFGGASVPENSNFITHFFFAQLLIIYMPFSKLLHFGGIFFSQTVLRRA